ncbi:MAG: hypothetical protein CMD16_01355 [Flavobacteriales bacterium]|nr:hypothetical protein [Flavobacteriales bacterium]|tara:strand:+ start:10633 stop:11469 length:837 start_codon:yes stop_codon:yes gene_type:complete
MLVRKFPVYLGALLLFFSCLSKKDNRIIASVSESDLFLSDILDEMPAQVEDSAYFVERYVNKWIREQLMVYNAEMNLSSHMKNYDKQIEDYRNSLLIYAYQQELLNQHLDTVIDKEDIESYYNQYIDQFKLTKNIFKGRFIVVNKLAPDIILLEKLVKSNKEGALDDLIDYCQQFAKEYYLEDDKWEYFSIFNEKLPELIVEEAYFLSNTKGVSFEDNVFRYYIYIDDYKLKGSLSPLDMERDKIQNVLLNKKKIEYLQQLEDELYQKGLALKKIKIY